MGTRPSCAPICVLCVAQRDDSFLFIQENYTLASQGSGGGEQREQLCISSNEDFAVQAPESEEAGTESRANHSSNRPAAGDWAASGEQLAGWWEQLAGWYRTRSISFLICSSRSISMVRPSSAISRDLLLRLSLEPTRHVSH